MAIQATRVLQHQTRIPPNGTTTSSTNVDAASTTVPTENGISEDPWIKRQQQQQQQQQQQLQQQQQQPQLDIPTSSAAVSILSLPSAPANVLPMPPTMGNSKKMEKIMVNG